MSEFQLTTNIEICHDMLKDRENAASSEASIDFFLRHNKSTFELEPIFVCGVKQNNYPA